MLAIIPARGGSKGLPGKNTKLFDGQPLICHTVKAALSSDLIDRVIVSTDSEDYRNIALESGAEVPFLRPSSISTDDAKEVDYILHCLNWLRENEGYQPDIVSRLQATSPLQLPDDIDRSIQCLEDDIQATSSMVVSKAMQPPMKAMKISEDNYLIPYCSDIRTGEVVNRQGLTEGYFRSNIISSRCSLLLYSKEQIGNKAIKVEIPIERSIDINTDIDLFIAEKIAEKLSLCCFVNK